MSKTAGMSGVQYGDWFEGVTQDALDELMREGPSFFCRLYDTRSAGTFLPAQAADFVGCHQGRAYTAECKASVVHESLASPGAMRKLIKDQQSLGAYLMGRAGGTGLFIFRSRLSQELEIWDGGQVRKAYLTPRAKLHPDVNTLLVRCNCPDQEVKHNLKYLFARALA